MHQSEVSWITKGRRKRSPKPHTPVLGQKNMHCYNAKITDQCARLSSLPSPSGISQSKASHGSDNTLHVIKIATHRLLFRGHGPPTVRSRDNSTDCISFLWRCFIDDSLCIWPIAELVGKPTKICDKRSLGTISRKTHEINGVTGIEGFFFK